MGNTDSVPVVSQVKSAVQYFSGDSAGALQTQENFAYNNTFPVVSQIASLGYYIDGKEQQAKDLQEKFLKDFEKVVDSIPVAGHIKGGVHYAMGEDEKGEEAMKAASRSTGVVVGGVGGFAVGGPAGAVAGGIAGGAAADAVITGSDMIAKGKDAKPYGYIAVGQDIADHIENKRNITVEQGFDMAMLPVSDGIGGYSAGKFIGKPLGFGKTASGSKIPLPGVRGGYRGGGAGVVSMLDDAAIAPGKAAAGNSGGGVIRAGAAGVVDDTVPLLPKKGNLNRLGLDQKALNNRANQLNPNHAPSGPGRPAGYRGAGNAADLNNHANQLNPNNPAYHASRAGNAVVKADPPVGTLVDV